MTVAGLTMRRTSVQRGHKPRSVVQKRRSREVNAASFLLEIFFGLYTPLWDESINKFQKAT